MNRIAALFALMALLSCAAPGEPEPGAPDVTVELDAFSGLPNPVWTLSASEAGELARRLRTLPRAEAAPTAEPGLGYRGFRIRNPGGDAGVPESVYVRRGGIVVVEDAGDPDTAFRDAHGLEGWLIAEARLRGYHDVFRGGTTLP